MNQYRSHQRALRFIASILLIQRRVKCLSRKEKAPSRSAFSASMYVALKTRHVNPNIHVRRYQSPVRRPNLSATRPQLLSICGATTYCYNRQMCSSKQASIMISFQIPYLHTCSYSRCSSLVVSMDESYWVGGGDVTALRGLSSLPRRHE